MSFGRDVFCVVATSFNTRPRVFWLAFGLVAPVAVLAVLATLALVRDWRTAQRDAAARAQEIAVAVAEQSASFLQQWTPLDPAGDRPAGFNSRQTVDWFEVGPSNELLWPPPAAWPPQPQPLKGDLGADQHEQWRAARGALAAGEWEKAAQLYEQFLGPRSGPSLESVTPDKATLEDSRYRAIALFERAITLERAGLTNHVVVEAFASSLDLSASPGVDTSTEAGVPLAHLAALKVLDVAGGQVDVLPNTWRSDPSRVARALAETPATPYLAEWVSRIRPLATQLVARASAPMQVTDFFEPFERAERARAGHTAARNALRSDGPWPDAFWIGDPLPTRLAVRQEKPLRPGATTPQRRRLFALLPEDSLRAEMAAATHKFDQRGEFVARMTIAGRELAGPGHQVGASAASADLGAVTRAGGVGVPVTATVGLADPQAFYASQRRRQWIFGGLLGGALGAALASMAATRRALLRQHELNRQKSNFVSSVSHELRAPIASARLLSESLERGTVTDEPRRAEYFRLIGQECRRLSGLIENVLDFGRIEQGRKQYEFEPTDLIALVGATAKAFEPLAQAQNVSVACRLPGSDCRLELDADGRALQQALLNLLDNALKHSSPGSAIEVELRPAASTDHEPASVNLSVLDHGPGIPSQEHARIFEPFYRRGSELRRDTQGVGIGLTIVKHIVEAHDGSVKVESDVGHGSRFTIALPTHNPRRARK